MHTDEDGYVFGVRKNALQILLPRYGLETTLFLRDKEGKSVGEFNEEVNIFFDIKSKDHNYLFFLLLF
jgi:hypothetical protein